MGSLEINTIRAFVVDALAKFNKLHAVAEMNSQQPGEATQASQQAAAAAAAAAKQQQAALQAAQEQSMEDTAPSSRSVQQPPDLMRATSQRRGANFRQPASSAAAASSPSSQYPAGSQGAALTQPSQPGATTAVEEQARKLRRFQH